MYFQLVPSTHRTEEIDAGLLPTPTAIQREHPDRVQALQETGATSMFSRANGEARPNSILDHLQFHGMLLTPRACESIERRNWKTIKDKVENGGDVTLTTLMKYRHKMGLLPTPTAMDSTNATATMKSSQVKEGSMHSVTLCRAMAMGMLPTPNSRDFKDAQTPEKYQARKEKWLEKGINLQLSLPQLVKNQMLPTPTTALTKHSDKEAYWKNRKDKGRQQDLAMVVHNQVGYNSQLNPQFVLEMMGFPPDWTELPFLNGETNPSKPEETP
jgi:hypothetical protein